MEDRKLAEVERVYAILESPVVVPYLQAWGEKIVGRDLSVIPAYRELPEGQENEWGTREDPTWRTEWFEWRLDVIKVRNYVQERYRKNLKFRQAEQLRCKNDPCWFIMMWLDVEEPRPDEDNLDEDDLELYEQLADFDDDDFDVLKPYILFAYQAKVVYIFAAVVRMPFKFDVFISKARGIGISYTILAVAFWNWLFRKGRGRFLSEKLEKAERALDLDSLFVKLDLFLESTPEDMLPQGFYGRSVKNRQDAMFKNPETKGQLTAEATTARSGRGGRATYTASDECASQIAYKATRATLSGTTNHRFDWSTESFEMGRQWWDAWRTAKKMAALARAAGKRAMAIVIELEWFENPYQDQQWYIDESARFESDGNPDAFAVEYLRNPHAGYGTYVYPIASECPLTSLGYDHSKMLMMSVDPGMSDDCAWVFWQKHYSDGGKKVIRWIDMYKNSRLPAEFYAWVMCGVMPPKDYDLYLRFRDEFEHPETQRILNFMAKIPPNHIRLYGDPASKSTDTGASSFRARLVSESRKAYALRGYEKTSLLILLPPEIIYKRNNLPDRRNALREALMYSEFSDTAACQELRDDIASVRFGEVTERTVHPPGQRHDRHTHSTSACEFGMIFETLKLTPSEMKSQVDAANKRARRQGATRQGRTPESKRRQAYRGRDNFMPSDEFMGVTP